MYIRTITKSWQQVGQDSSVSYNKINVSNSHRDGVRRKGRYRSTVSLVVIFGPKMKPCLCVNTVMSDKKPVEFFFVRRKC